MRKLEVRFLAVCVAILLPCFLHAQKKVPFNGILLDMAGQPIKRAHVYVTDHRAYALTTKEGKFGLTDVKGSDTLRIELKKKVYSIPVDGRKSMVIRLADERNYQAQEDQQLVDIGYGFVMRREHTGSAEAFISGQQLQESGQATIIDALVGRVPGLDITGQGTDRKITMRGTKSVLGDSTPLFVVDGIVTPSLDSYSLHDVDYVEIMKDGSIYGSAGANGAIVVHTKGINR